MAGNVRASLCRGGAASAPRSRHCAPAAGAVIAVAAVAAVLLGGCAVAARQAVSTARGGFSDVLVISPIRSLDGYESIRFIPIVNDVGDNVSSTILEQFNKRVQDELVARGASPPRGKVLELSGRIIHIETERLHKEVIVRVQLSDAGSGETIGVANVTGQADGISDVEDMANGLAEGAVKLLQKGRFPTL